jgi:hypothetical protein
MVMAMVIVVSIASLMAGLLSLNQSITQRQGQAVNTKLSFYLAEAGLAEAYAGLLIGKTGNVGSADEPAVYGNGLFWVVATDQADGTVELESTGMVGSGRATLSLVAERGETTVAARGMFSAADFSVGAGALIDGYDSAQGSYASQVLGGLAPLGAGRLGSNGAIAVSGSSETPTLINAEVAPGPDQEFACGEFVKLYGSAAPSAAEYPLPPVEVPDVALGRGVEHAGAVPLVLLSGTSGFEYLNVGRAAEVVVEGPATLAVGSLRLAPGAALTLDPTDGRIDVYVTRGLDLQAGSYVTTVGEDPSKVALHVAGAPAEPVRLAATSDFHGVVYAPEAELAVDQAFEVFGALIGGRVELAGAVALHFDRALAEQSVESSLPQMLSWRIVELSASGAVGVSPFAGLGVDPATLPLPHEAHSDQAIHVEYLDAGDVEQVYDGLESDFDWSDVKEVEYLTRDGVAVTALDEAKIPVAAADKAMMDLIASDTPARDITRDLIDNSPLSPAVLEAAMLRPVPLLSDHYRRILLANSPLPPRVLDRVTRSIPSLMTAAHRTAVLAAQ